MQIDTRLPTPLKPANTYPQQLHNYHWRCGWGHGRLRIQIQLSIFNWFILNYNWPPTIVNMWYLSHHAAITTQVSLIINPTQLKLFTAAMAADKQAWDWCIVVILMLSEKACETALGWDAYWNTYILIWSVQMHIHTLQNILIKDRVSWAQVMPLEYAKQATTEQNPQFQTQSTNEAQRSRMPQTPHPPRELQPQRRLS